MARLDKNRFVEREDQIKEFEKMLADPWDENRICAIVGPGGIGKTWLMRAMIEKARNWKPAVLAPDTLIDMYSTEHRYLEGVMDAVVARLQDLVEQPVFAEYRKQRLEVDKAREQYEKQWRESGKESVTAEYSEEAIEGQLRALKGALRDCLAEITRRQAVVLAFDTFEHVQDSPVGQWILDPQGLRMPGLVCIIASSLSERELDASVLPV